MAGGSAYAAWGGSLFLPIHLVDGCVVLLKDVRAIFSLELIRKVESTLHQFHSLVRPGSKRRRVQQARNQMSAWGGGFAQYSGIAPVDEAVPTSSSSSSSDRLLLSPPDWLIHSSSETWFEFVEYECF